MRREREKTSKNVCGVFGYEWASQVIPWAIFTEIPFRQAGQLCELLIASFVSLSFAFHVTHVDLMKEERKSKRERERERERERRTHELLSLVKNLSLIHLYTCCISSGITCLHLFLSSFGKKKHIKTNRQMYTCNCCTYSTV